MMRILRENNGTMIISVKELMDSASQHSRISSINRARSNDKSVSFQCSGFASDVSDLFVNLGWERDTSGLTSRDDLHSHRVSKDGITLNISGGYNMSHDVLVAGMKADNYRFDYSGLEHSEKEYVLTVVVKYNGDPSGIVNSARQRGTITGQIQSVRVKENNY